MSEQPIKTDHLPFQRRLLVEDAQRNNYFIHQDEDGKLIRITKGIHKRSLGVIIFKDGVMMRNDLELIPKNQMTVKDVRDFLKLDTL